MAIATLLNPAVRSEYVRRIELPEWPMIYLFEVQRRERRPIFVLWERCDTFTGEDQLATAFS